MCDEAVDDSLATMKLIPDWSVTSKMINFSLFCMQVKIYSMVKILIVLYIFNCNGMGMLNIDLNNINLDNNFDWYYYSYQTFGLAY